MLPLYLYLQTLGVLSQDGIVRYININSCKLLFDVGTIDNKVNNFSISPSGRHMVSTMEDGSLHVYDLHVVSDEIGKVIYMLRKEQFFCIC